MYNFKIGKLSLYIIALVSLSTTAKAQLRDTSYYFIKEQGSFRFTVDSLANADFIRMIPPFKLKDDLTEIKEIYKNGVIKLVGKVKTSTINLKKGSGDLEGTCMNFYPTGKRRSITNYKEDSKTGLQYLYYPDGKLFMILNNIFKRNVLEDGYTIVDVYDKNGMQVCNKGTGIAIIYDKDFNELIRGPVTDGYMNGEWHGLINEGTVGKYTHLYKNNLIVSGVGFESSTGKFYPFQSDFEPATSPKSLTSFVNKLKSRIKLSKGTSVTQKMIDSVEILFIVEEDGRLTQLKTNTPIPEELMLALKLAFEQCDKWTPVKLYGIPAQAQVTLNLGLKPAIGLNSYTQSVENKQVIVYKNVLLSSLNLFRELVPRD
jgi:hypothetical protein